MTDEEIIPVSTQPLSFAHGVVEAKRRHPGSTQFIVDWHYGPDNIVNKDVDEYRVSVYDKIPRKSVWDYTDSPTRPTEIVSNDLDEDTVSPIMTVRYKPGEAGYSVDAHSYILDEGLADPVGERRATHYRWVEVEAYIVCDPDYIEYGFKEGEV
jgi:hypothetical protein